MGGFSDILGHAAAGFEQARQVDLARKFEDEQNRRNLLSGIFQKLAGDPTVHPDVRNASTQAFIDLGQMPHDKAADWKKVLDPIFQTASMTMGQPGQQVTAPAQPYRGMPMTSQLQTPPEPPGIFKSHAELLREAEEQAAGVTRAQAGAQAKYPVMTRQPEGGISQQFYSGTGQPMGQPIKDVYNPTLVRPFLSGIKQVTYADPQTGMPLPGTHDTLGFMGVPGAVYDQKGELVPNAQIFSAGLVPKKVSGSTTTPGGLTTTREHTITPQPKGAKGETAQPSGGPLKPRGGVMKGVHPPPAVEAEMDNIMKVGVPAGKLNDAQALAVKELKRQGIDPVVAATPAARTSADRARMIRPLIQKARQLIAANPNALGPLAGRWSELSQKVGNLSGPPKELAGTLISIYSLAGSLHGWRAIRVADEFRKAYGDLSSNAASLNSGLDAMQNTVDNIEKIGYPGGPGGEAAGGASASSHEGKTATGPNNHKIIVRGGVWVDATTGQPIK